MTFHGQSEGARSKTTKRWNLNRDPQGQEVRMIQDVSIRFENKLRKIRATIVPS